ncbi:putative fatty acid elongation protein 3 [Halotydeus destructor]|nr:putative fatty acid elongation protein 3 [Halotydeus destructor]
MSTSTVCHLPIDGDSFYIFPVERNYDACYWTQWMTKFYDNWCLSVLTAYIVVVFALKTLMRDRKPFELRGPLITWNLALAIFSVLGSIGVGAELFSLLFNEGLDATVCSPNYRFNSAGFWQFMFALSKMAEFVDSVFIVLRKKPLIFLHYYHHVETCWYTMFQFTRLVPLARWCTFINLAVHSVMYSYYAIRAMGFRVPRQVAMAITTLQCAQMYLCLYLISRAVYLQCEQNYAALAFGSLQYLIYAGLFTNYFIQSYFGKKSKSATDKSNGEVNGKED